MTGEWSHWAKENSASRRAVLTILILLVCGGTASQGQINYSLVRGSANLECLLKEGPPACEVKSGEELRSLNPGETIEREISGRERHLYRVTLSAGQFISSVVDQRGIDLKVALCSAGGEPVAEVDRQTGSWGPEAISMVTTAGGEYLLLVKPILSTAFGRYELRIKDLRSAEPIDEIRINAERIATEGGKFYSQGGPACLRESIVRYEQALRFWQSLGETEETAMTLYGLGWSYSDLGAFGMVKFPLARHRLRWNYNSREDHQLALKYFQKGMELFQTLANQHGQAISLAGMAWPNLYLGRTEAALSSFSDSGRLFRHLRNKRGEAISTYGLGWAYALLNENEKALDNFSRALFLRRQAEDSKGEAATLSALSRVYSRLGRFEEALDHGKQALTAYEKLGDTRGQASSYSTLGWIYNKLGRQSESLHSFRESLKAQRPDDDTGRANNLYGIAHVQNDLNNLDDALAEMENVLRIVEPLRDRGSASDLRTYYFANVQEYYDFYIELLMRLHRDHPQNGFAVRALEASERARARELLAVLAESDDLRQHEYDEVLTRPLNATEIRKLLDEETVLLEYFLGDERSYVWLVSATDVQVHTLPKRAELESKAQLLYKQLTERNRTAEVPDSDRKQHLARADLGMQKSVAELGQTLLQPLMDRLQSKRVVIVSQGALQLIPWAALSVVDLKTRVSSPFFVGHEIVNLPSFSILPHLRRNESNGPMRKIAVLADPVFTSDDPRIGESADGRPPITGASLTSNAQRVSRQVSSQGLAEVGAEQNYRRLLGTRWEAQQILALVPQEDAFVALDFAASRKTAMSGMLGNFRIIHFATHAYVNDSNPALSKIVFSQFNENGEPEDGNLTLADVYNLKLRAELVVLSACQTGLGVHTRGEGLIGLTGGFMHAGVSRVLVSLWPISDRAAAEFMAKFYRRLLGPRKLSPSAALREVQIETWKDDKWKAAYFWAPFVINGEWNWQSR